MRTATYKSIIDRIAGYMGEADGLTVEDAVLANAKINFFVRMAWEHFWWPELMELEDRTFRPAYSAAENIVAPTATAAQERYFIPDGQYYQALRAQTPATQAPATLVGGDYQENSAYWAVAAGSYSGEDWAAGDYAVGDQVRNPDDNRFYQCHTAHTAVGSFDATKFGILTPFVRSLEYEQTGETALGEVRRIWDANPDVIPGACWMPFVLRRDYVLVRGFATLVWVEFRARPNVFTGATRSDTATYSSGDERYDTATGDYWIANAAIAAGESPTTNPEKWDQVEFPYLFSEFVAQSAYAMLTNPEQEQPENFTIQMAAGYPLLLAEMDKIERQQGQTRQLNVVSGRR